MTFSLSFPGRKHNQIASTDYCLSILNDLPKKQLAQISLWIWREFHESFAKIKGEFGQSPLDLEETGWRLAKNRLIIEFWILRLPSAVTKSTEKRIDRAIASKRRTKLKTEFASSLIIVDSTGTATNHS